MGTWRNVAFVECDDPPRVAHALEALVVARGRTIVHPAPRTPDRQDPMQYGSGDEVRRWALASFAGAPGWTVVRTAPFELLLQPRAGGAPLLVELCRRLGARAFQFNVYDGDSQLLYEVDRDGRVEVTGYCGIDPQRHHDDELGEDRVDARFRIVDVEPAAIASLRLAPHLRVGGHVPSATGHAYSPELAANLSSRRMQLLAWVEAHGELHEGRFLEWRAHPAHVVRALAAGGARFFSIEGATDEAIAHVFGGANALHCDNRFLGQTLIPHRPLPVDGIVSFADAER